VSFQRLRWRVLIWLSSWVFVMAPPVRGQAPDSAASGRLASLLPYTDDIARAMGIGLLRDSGTAANRDEVRIWVGFGIYVPETLLRMWKSSVGWSGELLLHWRLDTLVAPIVRRNLDGACRRLDHRDRMEWCVAKLSPEVDWAGFVADLAALGLYTLPDESTLPRTGIITFDGTSMVVETRVGTVYRSYEFSNPQDQPWPEARKAEAILQKVGHIESRMTIKKSP
jgi:hypothetical protein